MSSSLTGASGGALVFPDLCSSLSEHHPEHKTARVWNSRRVGCARLRRATAVSRDVSGHESFMVPGEQPRADVSSELSDNGEGAASGASGIKHRHPTRPIIAFRADPPRDHGSRLHHASRLLVAATVA